MRKPTILALLFLAFAECVFSQPAATTSSDSGRAQKQGKTVSDRGPGVIQMKSGTKIFADAIRQTGDKLEYDKGDDTYVIPMRLVSDVVFADTKQPSDEPNASKGEKRNFEELGATIEEIRNECNSLLAHASDEERGGLEYQCAIMNVDMGTEYESKIDRGARLERRLCKYGNGRLPDASTADSAVAANLRELHEIQNWFEQQAKKWMKTKERKEAELQSQADVVAPNWRTGKLTPDEAKRFSELDAGREVRNDALRDLRMLTDSARIDGSCGKD